MSHQWSQDFFVDNPVYCQIASLAKCLAEPNEWPGLDQYNSLLSNQQPLLKSMNDAVLRFVEQDEKTSDPFESYEARIYLRGEIQTRCHNWHDYFQVLIWCAFSKTKRLINKRHYLALAQRINMKAVKQRSSIENMLTLFDECGAIIVSSNPALLENITEFEWTTLFMDNRDKFETEIKCFTFGHALYEKFLSPYIGMTAHAICLPVDESFFLLNESQQLEQVDDLACRYLEKNKDLSPALLNPFPILGVPGWDGRNEDPDFYQNKDYFRPKRRASLDSR